MLNVIFENNTFQVYYNIIHWLLGIRLIITAILDYRARRNKKYSVSASLVFALSGLLAIVYVTAGYAHYSHKWFWPWQVNSEQTVHITIGAAWFVGGLIAVLARKNYIKLWLQYAMPVALVFSGLRFVLSHQHSANPGTIAYLTTYHDILGSLLIASGVFMCASFALKRRIAWLPATNLIIMTMAGLVFLAYRHPLQVSSLCDFPGSIRRIDISKRYTKPLSVNLCDQVVLMTTDNKIYEPALGAHSHHIHYPNFEGKSCKKGQILLV